jgi:hypothetical protein
MKKAIKTITVTLLIICIVFADHFSDLNSWNTVQYENPPEKSEKDTTVIENAVVYIPDSCSYIWVNCEKKLKVIWK